jgi:hypothetical protein
MDNGAVENLGRLCRNEGIVPEISLPSTLLGSRRPIDGPLLKTFGALDPKAQTALTEDLFALIKRARRCPRAPVT